MHVWEEQQPGADAAYTCYQAPGFLEDGVRLQIVTTVHTRED